MVEGIGLIEPSDGRAGELNRRGFVRLVLMAAASGAVGRGPRSVISGFALQVCQDLVRDHVHTNNPAFTQSLLLRADEVIQ